MPHLLANLKNNYTINVPFSRKIHISIRFYIYGVYGTGNVHRKIRIFKKYLKFFNLHPERSRGICPHNDIPNVEMGVALIVFD